MVQIPKVAPFSSLIHSEIVFYYELDVFSQGGQFSESKDSKISGNFLLDQNWLLPSLF
jgi:hypothetical protein